MILRYMWLKHHNPEIDWETGTVKMTQHPETCQHFRKSTMRFLAQLEAEEQENAWHAYYLRVATEILPLKTEKTTEELVPKEYHKFLKVFSKGESEHMPLRKPWDHAIDLKDMFQPKKGHIIPLSPMGQEDISAFIDDQLQKGYIQLSKSEQTSPVSFIPKKDGKKQMVQDYCYLNEHTVKNNYPLPLISQLVDKLKGTKLFTKMDLRWGYNNVWIEEGNEWKAAFICFRGAYEPLVIYFGLCNSPATFQTMMNKIFVDMEDVVLRFYS